LRIEGRAFLLLDERGELIKDIDTDQIYHNQWLFVTDPKEMGQYALRNLKGYEDFPEKVKRGDIIIAGSNFGAGSSRQHAVTCFLSLEIGAIVASSFGAIYKRNAINSALPILECEVLEDLVKRGKLRHGDKVTVIFEEGKLILSDGEEVQCKRPSKVQLEILEAGGLLEHGKKVL
jgi:3-isopropylmalate/(R)-2-methylmalate dehydratase small subunit